MQINKVISLFLLLSINVMSASENIESDLKIIEYEKDEYASFCEEEVIFPSSLESVAYIKRASHLNTREDREFFEARLNRRIKVGCLISELPPSLCDVSHLDFIGRIQGYFFSLLQPNMYMQFMELKVLDKYRLALKYVPLHIEFVIEKRP